MWGVVIETSIPSSVSNAGRRLARISSAGAADVSLVQKAVSSQTASGQEYPRNDFGEQVPISIATWFPTSIMVCVSRRTSPANIGLPSNARQYL